MAGTVLALVWSAGLLYALPQVNAPAEAEAFDRLAAELGTLDNGVEPEIVAQRIHALGSPFAPVVFEALSRDELPSHGSSLVLGEREHRVLLDGARRIGREAFLRPCSEAVASADGRKRRTVVELVGLVGRSGDLGTAVQAATPTEEGTHPDPDAVAALEQATERLLERDQGTIALLRPAIVHASPELAGAMIQAAGHEPSDRTLRFLVDLLGFEPHLELSLLSQIARVVRGQTPPFEEEVRARVRSYLGNEDRQVVRAAAMALAELQDEDALPALLDLSASPDNAVSGSAFAALERTTGLSLPRRTDRWRSWFAVEQEWMGAEGARALAELKCTSAPRIQSALREIASHRLGRQRLSALVAGLLAHPEPGVRLEACRTLRALASPVARASLEQVLSDADPEVAAAAASALQALRGEPESPRAATNVHRVD